MKNSHTPLVQSVERAIQILELLHDDPSLTMSEISRKLDVHRSTVLRLLATLEAHDLVEQDASPGSYQLGSGLLRLAGSVTERMDLVRDAQATCESLAEKLNETVNAAILDDGYAVTITQAEGDRILGVMGQYVGQRTPLHASSTGKLLLAYAPEEVFRDLVQSGLESFTEMTITDPEILRKELEMIRYRGWAAVSAELEHGINALAVPIRGQGDQVVAALSTTAPSFRFPESQFGTIAGILTQEAEKLAAKLSLF